MAQKRVSFGTVALAVLESGFYMGGHYLREIAVLILVFVPLDFWKHQEITTLRLFGVGAISLLVLFCGMVCEWTSYGVKRGKKVWEQEEGTA